MYDTGTNEAKIQIIDLEGTVVQTISVDKEEIVSGPGFAHLYLHGLKNGQFVLSGIHAGALSIQHYHSNSTESEGWKSIEEIDASRMYEGFADDNEVSFLYRLLFTGYDPGLFGYYNPQLNKLAVYSMGPSKVDAQAPTIKSHPEDKTVIVGAYVSLGVEASVSDGGTLSYQWYSNSTNSTTGGTLINRATDASNKVPTGTAGTTYYYVVVTNTVSENNKASTTSNAAKVTVEQSAQAPTIKSHPADKTDIVGAHVSLSVEASVSDGGTLSYQWYSNSTNSTTGGTPINGATSASYEAPTGTAGTTYYYVVVTNTNNTVSGNKTATRQAARRKSPFWIPI